MQNMYKHQTEAMDQTEGLISIPSLSQHIPLRAATQLHVYCSKIQSLQSQIPWASLATEIRPSRPINITSKSWDPISHDGSMVLVCMLT